MPIHTGQDKNGKFYQWGKTGKKYYFKPGDKQSKQRALNKAKKQQTAIYSSGWKGDSKMKLIRVNKKDAGLEGWEVIPEKYRPQDKKWSSSYVSNFPSGVKVVVYNYQHEENPNYVSIYTPTSNKMRYTTLESPDRMQKTCDFFEPILKDLEKAIPLAKKVEKEIAQYQSKIKNV